MLYRYSAPLMVITVDITTLIAVLALVIALYVLREGRRSRGNVGETRAGRDECEVQAPAVPQRLCDVGQATDKQCVCSMQCSCVYQREYTDARPPLDGLRAPHLRRRYLSPRSAPISLCPPLPRPLYLRRTVARNIELFVPLPLLDLLPLVMMRCLLGRPLAMSQHPTRVKARICPSAQICLQPATGISSRLPLLSPHPWSSLRPHLEPPPQRTLRVPHPVLSLIECRLPTGWWISSTMSMTSRSTWRGRK